MKIAFIPIDNRPVCYTLPKLIAGIDKSVEFSIPPREFLGDLTKYAKSEQLFKWLEEIEIQDAIIISLDTLIYGGLISSRRCELSYEQLAKRVHKLKDILSKKDAKIYAFSSIMRVSNNNYNEEEKEYWLQYGKKIFKYSYDLHKYGQAKTDVPHEVLEDYLATRKRNFGINKLFLSFQKEGLFNTLIFSKDDCAEFGLNVQEAQELEKLGAYTKTGADEIPLSLLARAIQKEIKICPIFTEPEYKHLISNYEDIPIEASVKGQIELAGCKISSKEDADILLYINNFISNQGEIVMKVDTQNFSKEFITPQKPYMIADVRFANGADNNFVTEFLKNNISDDKFYGYSAWNTSANSLGSLICTAKFKFHAKNYNKESFDKIQITRFIDDWGYQANVRQLLQTTDISLLTEKIKPYEQKIKQIFSYNGEIKYSFPWNRLFEVEIEFS